MDNMFAVMMKHPDDILEEFPNMFKDSKYLSAKTQVIITCQVIRETFPEQYARSTDSLEEARNDLKILSEEHGDFFYIAVNGNL